MEGLPRIETLDRPSCVQLLRSAAVGRLVFAVPSEPPGVVPVTFVVEGPPGAEHVVVRTTRGSRLSRSAPGSVVSFEVDDIQASTHEGWSVVASGTAVEVTDPAEVRRVGERLEAWAPGFQDVFVRVPLSTLTGRRLVSRERVIQLPDSPSPRWREVSGWAPATRTAAQYSTDFDGR